MADFLPGRTSRPALWRWGEGPRVLLMHGWGGCAGQMTPLVEPLTAAGFSVLAVEAPGHGEAPGRQASIPAFADTIAQVARAEGPLQAVVAHSMGGAGASLAVARGLRLERAAYLGPPADALVWLRAYARWLGLDEAATLRLQARAEVVAGEPLGHLNAAWLGPRLPMPLLVVHDRQDREVPFEDGAAVASSAPRGRLVETRGLGHRRLLRDAAVGQLVARFVAGAGEAELGPVEAGAERAG
jgi:pimeloyl-ACP methyl ester carboxylesterase